jgi:ribosomal protein S18 acetylase RimI-like enzyme
MSIRIVPFNGAHVSDAARMFVACLEVLRRRVAALPPDLADIGVIRGRLTSMTGVAALEDERLVGYLTSWFPIDGFRGTTRIGAYVPEWAHGAVGTDRRAVYNALYRAASMAWSDAGCDVHAITLLDGDDVALETWFWSGFGMGTVDAVRPTTPLGAPVVARSTVRMATAADAPALAILDLEHVRHYAAAPVFMVPPAPQNEEAWRTFLGGPRNAVWLVEDTAGPYGFIRFDPEFHGSAVVESSTGIFISGAYVRPAHRRRGAATAMLDAAMRRYAVDGTTFCAVDYEAFNPEASSFWARHFTPVCCSLMRVPETSGSRADAT